MSKVPWKRPPLRAVLIGSAVGAAVFGAAAAWAALQGAVPTAIICGLIGMVFGADTYRAQRWAKAEREARSQQVPNERLAPPTEPDKQT